MKAKKILCSAVVASTIVLSSVTALASSVSGRWYTPYDTFAGYLNSLSGHQGQSITVIEARSSSYANTSNRPYAYLEAIDSNGYRITSSMTESYGVATGTPSRADTGQEYVYGSAGNHYYQLATIN
ncbi:MAG: hypothetical protein Q8936_00310 [Bacillota bacterium]|nr:hypothetical protein [Bacillota bacterium]